MQLSLRVTAALAGLAAAAACATTPVANPRVAAAEANLSRANADPITHDLGRASLEKATLQLVEARDALRRRDDDDFTHAIRMTENYIELAETRGEQGKAEQAIEAFEGQQAQLRLNSRDRDVTQAEAGRDRAEAGQARAENALRGMREELADYQLQETALGMSLVLQDLQFASDSSILRAGAEARLDPLAAYLTRNESANIRIAGHTDSLGDGAYNRDLSQRRAASVAAYLVTRGVLASHIEAVGMGEDAPVASNDTTSGREENRRVEVTILGT